MLFKFIVLIYFTLMNESDRFFYFSLLFSHESLEPMQVPSEIQFYDFIYSFNNETPDRITKSKYWFNRAPTHSMTLTDCIPFRFIHQVRHIVAIGNHIIFDAIAFRFLRESIQPPTKCLVQRLLTHSRQFEHPTHLTTKRLFYPWNRLR